MKKNVIVHGIFAVTLIIALAFTACSQPSDPGIDPGNDPNNPSGTSGKLTINGLPSGSTHAVYVFSSGTDISTFTAIVNAYSSNSYQAVGATATESVFDLYGWNGTATTTAWTGSGSLPVLLLNSSGSITGTTNPMYSWTTITFTNGNGSASFSSFTAVEYDESDPYNPVDPNNPKGKLTINNIPSGNSLAITVYNYDGEIASQMDLTGVQTDLSKLVAVSFGIANSSPVSMVKSGGSTSTFDGTGTYLIIMAVNTTSVRYAEQVTFTNGCAEINFSTLLNMIDLPLIPVDPNQNPTAGDFVIGNLTQAVGSVTAVTITPKDGKSTGDITIYYDNSTTLPTAVGTYTVTFDVEASEGWNAKSGLSAGTLSIKVVDYAATSVAALGTWLASQPSNTEATAYIVLLNVNDLGGRDETVGSAGYVLKANSNKYVKLDLSGSTISSIGYCAFYNCSSLTSIIIPDSVTSIAEGAFTYTKLTSVTIPNSVTEIGGDRDGIGVFSGCTSLTSVIIGNKVTSIGRGAFCQCTNLSSVIIGNKVTSIGEYAFSECTKLASITIPNSVISIVRGAFNRTNLTSITLPESVTSIGEQAFEYCTILTSVTFATGSNITDTNFGNSVFPEGSNGWGGDTLKNAYSSGKAGTYTRTTNGSTWAKK